jgi:hypothetical protein
MAKAKSVTPYIVFASEIRKSIVETNKSLSFGEISRLVGDKVSFNFTSNHLTTLPAGPFCLF